MARPLGIRFFEVPLPEDLPPNLEWLRLYHHNSKALIGYLSQQGAGSTAYHATLRCLAQLRQYLIESKTEYSSSAALEWLEKDDFSDKGTMVTLQRLSDLYQYGYIQPIHAFPIARPYYNELDNPWREHLDSFLSSLPIKESSFQQKKCSLARFLYRMQEKGIQNVDQISFALLEEYCSKEAHSSHKLEGRYTYVIGEFILFMADKGLCSHGIGWYPYFRMHNRILRFSDLTADQVERIEAVRDESQDFSAEEFAAVIPDFLDRYQSLGYTNTPQKVAKSTLMHLLLFLSMHDLGYHPIIAEVWLEHEKTRVKSSGWKQCRRVLHLFEVYTAEGDVIPQLYFREKPLLSDGLPDWCKSQLDAFLVQKTREGWAASTLCMYRSSVTRFCFFLCAEGLTSFSEINAACISSFNRKDKHLTAEGKNAYNVRIRAFLQFLERSKVIPYGLHMALYCTAESHENTVITLTDEEITGIRNAHANCITPIQLRNRAIVLLGVKMGIRAIDIVRIRLQDIDWDEQVIRFIQKKTVHEVRLPMPTVVGNAIYLYLKEGRPQTDSDFLFVKHHVPFNSLSRSACLKALKETLPNRNVPRSGFHVTRKTYATEKLRKGTARQTIAELLGHQDTSSLHQYLSLDIEHMRQCPLTLENTNLTLEENRYGI